MLHPFDEFLTEIALAPPTQIRYHSQKNESRVAGFLPMQTRISIGFGVGCELNSGSGTEGPVSTRSAQTILVDACNLHEGAGKGCEHRSDPSGNEEDDRYRDADPCAPQATKPTEGLPVLLVFGSFEMAPC